MKACVETITIQLNKNELKALDTILSIYKEAIREMIRSDEIKEANALELELWTVCHEVLRRNGKDVIEKCVK